MEFSKDQYSEKDGILRKLIHRDDMEFGSNGECRIVMDLYYVGEESDFPYFPDGSWFELEISFENQASFDGPYHTVKIHGVEHDMDAFENMKSFAKICKNECAKFTQALEKMFEGGN